MIHTPWHGLAIELQFLSSSEARVNRDLQHDPYHSHAAQRKGVGAAMTCLPLQEAKAAGYRLGILHSSEMGIGVYRSLGFKDYCKIGQYVWAPETEA